MLRLNPTNATRTITLSEGITVDVIPLTSALWAAAGADPAIKPIGPGNSAEVLTVNLVKSIARLTIIGWTGVGDMDGEPVPPTPEWIDLLFDHWVLYNEFNTQFVGPYVLMSAEGNGSASLQTGNSKGATATATGARKPARNARSRSTNRKP